MKCRNAFAIGDILLTHLYFFVVLYLYISELKSADSSFSLKSPDSSFSLKSADSSFSLKSADSSFRLKSADFLLLLRRSIWQNADKFLRESVWSLLRDE